MVELLKKLSQVQIELKAPKGQYNSFGKYAYRSCEDILEAVKPLLHKNGLVLTVGDEVECINNRYYIRATAIVYDIESGECTKCAAYARESEVKKGMDDSQVTGTASSYARKYALNGLFNIDDTKDADTPEFNKCGESGKQAQVKSNMQEGSIRQKVYAKVKEMGIDINAFAKEKGLTKETSEQELEKIYRELTEVKHE